MRLAVAALALVWLRRARAYNVYACGQVAAWPLRLDDSAEMTSRFQAWLFWRQNPCLNGSRAAFHEPSTRFSGYSSVLCAVGGAFAAALELNRVTRPVGYRWAFVNATRCSRGVAAPDCFTLPLTYCGAPGDAVPAPPPALDFDGAQEFLPSAVDICAQARRAKKPLLWVFGQYLLFQLRLSPALQRRVDDEVDEVFELLGAATARDGGQNCLTAALHVRTAQPDEGRVALDGRDHLVALQRLNDDLRTSWPNHRICGVYVASDGPNATVFAGIAPGQPTRMDEFTVLLMPRFTGDGTKEMEFLLYDLNGNYDALQMYLEYRIDVEVMVRADVFLGSSSYFVPVVAALRSVRSPLLPARATCFISSLKAEVQHFLQPVCEDDPHFYQSSHVLKDFDSPVNFF